ncbi:MAG: ion transporter, partial [Oscillospiraceae bacterium]|nr:ion transporter [Oscillospiraceae bacterium]
MYGAEHDAQPENFRNAFSGIWWSMSTLLTVGYGDIYPVTTVGKAMAICIAFLGVGVVAIPTGIISAGFVEQYTQKEHADTCLQDVCEVGEILLDAEHDFCGQTVADVQTHYQLQILLVLRSGLTVLPRGEMTLEPQDLIILHSDKIVK